jgi:pimeloyl-ACP methyl ester carboxylesterase
MPAAPASASGFQDIFIPASDGLQLHLRCIGPQDGDRPAVVCLPGLTRTANDFDTLAAALVNCEPGRRVISIDYRGRGLSDYDANPDNYSPLVELTDVVTALTALDVLPAVFVGTSRGGILTMLLAASRPDAIVAAVLNDIGPVIELQGLLRIKSYVGRMPEPKDYTDAAATLRGLFGTQFPKLTADDWLASAQRAFKDENGRLVPTYDVRLAKTLEGVAPDAVVPSLWPQFDALAAVPVMVIRGLLSDLLSAQTVAAMREHHPRLEVVEVPDQGHAPLLADDATIRRIAAFIDRVV